MAITGLTVVGGLRVASAQSADSAEGSIVDKIAATFNLNKDEVQKVFDQDRDERQSKMAAKREERLATAVSEGSLTQEQADKLKAKHEELKALMDSLKDKSRDERHQAMEAKRSELEQWVKDNNIPDEYTHFLHGPKPGGPPKDMPEN